MSDDLVIEFCVNQSDSKSQACPASNGGDSNADN